MLNKLIFVTLSIFATSALGVNADFSAIIKEEDKAVTLAMDESTWSYVAAASSSGMSKVREFHDMGTAGVQQLDYVVSCTSGKLALASFKVLTEMKPDVTRATEPSIDSVAFYKPVIQHDMIIVKNVCGSSLASNTAARMD